MYKVFELNGKKYITFETVISNSAPYATRTITRRLYSCRPTKTNGNHFFIVNGRKFWPDDAALEII